MKGLQASDRFLSSSSAIESSSKIAAQLLLETVSTLMSASISEE